MILGGLPVRLPAGATYCSLCSLSSVSPLSYAGGGSERWIAVGKKKVGITTEVNRAFHLATSQEAAFRLELQDLDRVLRVELETYPADH